MFTYDMDPPAIIILHKQIRKARKIHQCENCGGIIHKGKRYLSTAIINDDGKFEYFKQHRGRCDALR